MVELYPIYYSYNPNTYLCAVITTARLAVATSPNFVHYLPFLPVYGTVHCTLYNLCSQWYLATLAIAKQLYDVLLTWDTLRTIKVTPIS